MNRKRQASIWIKVGRGDAQECAEALSKKRIVYSTQHGMHKIGTQHGMRDEGIGGNCIGLNAHKTDLICSRGGSGRRSAREGGE